MKLKNDYFLNYFRRRYLRFPVSTLFLFFTILSCTQISQQTEESAFSIFPDYADVVIPVNIAPLNFYIHNSAPKHLVRFAMGTDSFEVVCRNSVSIPQRKWEKLLGDHPGETLSIKVFAKENGEWKNLRNQTLYVAPELIDSYIAYRLIEPGYEFWGKMGIYQRCLENFDETPVLINTLTDGNCMNCHSFCKNNPDKMLFHMRTHHGGTMFVDNGQIVKMDMKTDDNISAAVYPRWHPDGRYVAFSVNKTSQLFHTSDPNLIEVYDSASDLIIYDTETQTISSNSAIHSSGNFETFPEWSPDGKWLYFCSAVAQEMPENYDSLRYNIFRVDFNVQTGETGNRLDTVLMASEFGKSAAFPRISPDGRFLLLCLSNYGTFPIWHKENDLYLFRLEDNVLMEMNKMNSSESDSYHSWSSNGRWIVFGSRRLDGLYTRPFIAYSDSAGRDYKPFLLPQKDPLHYNKSMKSFNIPEFITGKIEPGMRTLERAAKKPAVKVKKR